MFIENRKTNAPVEPYDRGDHLSGGFRNRKSSRVFLLMCLIVRKRMITGMVFAVVSKCFPLAHSHIQLLLISAPTLRTFLFHSLQLSRQWANIENLSTLSSWACPSTAPYMDMSGAQPACDMMAPEEIPCGVAPPVQIWEAQLTDSQ